MNRQLRLSCISDIHLGARKNTADAIIANLNKCFSCDAHFSQLDMVVVVGDVFDEALTLASEYVAHIDAWVARVLRLAYKHQVVVRVLEGTPSHDRGQSERFTIINALHTELGHGVDLKHVKVLSIEHFDAWDMDVLYVPDEWNHSCDATLEEVHALMAAKGLVQVDFAMMHGSMDYQLPAHIKSAPRHDSASYGALTRSLVFIGHIHIYSRVRNIIAQGSFDRLAHGEEGAKGFVSAIVQPSGQHTARFIENKGARKYVTVVCTGDAEESLRLLDAQAAKLPSGSCLRVEASYLDPILSDLDALRLRWPLLVWSALPKGKEDPAEQAAACEEYVYVPVSVRRDNITELVLARLAKLGLGAATLALCEDNLKEVERL